MRFLSVILFALFLSSMMQSCSQKPLLSGEGEVVNKQVYYAHFIDVWDKAIELVNEQKMPVQILDLKSGLVVSEMLPLSEREIEEICDRRDDRWHSWTKSRYQLTIHVKELRDSVTRLQVHVQPSSFSGVQNKWFELSSNGKMEKEIFAFMRSKGLSELLRR